MLGCFSQATRLKNKSYVSRNDDALTSQAFHLKELQSLLGLMYLIIFLHAEVCNFL